MKGSRRTRGAGGQWGGGCRGSRGAIKWLGKQNGGRREGRGRGSVEITYVLTRERFQRRPATSQIIHQHLVGTRWPAGGGRKFDSGPDWSAYSANKVCTSGPGANMTRLTCHTNARILHISHVNDPTYDYLLTIFLLYKTFTANIKNTYLHVFYLQFLQILSCYR